MLVHNSLRLSIVPLLLAALPVAAVAGTPAAAVSSSTAPGTPAETSLKAEKKICKLLPRTGTRLEPRFCLTKSDWKKVEADI